MIIIHLLKVQIITMLIKSHVQSSGVHWRDAEVSYHDASDVRGQQADGRWHAASRRVSSSPAAAVNVHFWTLRGRRSSSSLAPSRPHASRGSVTTAVKDPDVGLLHLCDRRGPTTGEADEGLTRVPPTLCRPSADPLQADSRALLHVSVSLCNRGLEQFVFCLVLF